MEFRFIEEVPSTGATAAMIEGAGQDRTQSRAGAGVPRPRPRRGEQLAIDEFGDKVIGHLQEVVVGRPLCRAPGGRHGARIARAPGTARRARAQPSRGPVQNPKTQNPRFKTAEVQTGGPGRLDPSSRPVHNPSRFRTVPAGAHLSGKRATTAS